MCGGGTCSDQKVQFRQRIAIAYSLFLDFQSTTYIQSDMNPYQISYNPRFRPLKAFSFFVASMSNGPKIQSYSQCGALYLHPVLKEKGKRKKEIRKQAISSFLMTFEIGPSTIVSSMQISL